MIEIDDAIGRVEQLYRAVTGKDPPAAEAAYAPIPAEREPTKYVEEQLDRLLGVLGQPLPTPMAAPWQPPASIWEGDNDVVIFVDVAGVARDNLEIAQHGNVVTITGLRPAPVQDGYVLRASERPMGPFRRVIALPAGLRTGELAAHVRDGVLELRVPKEVSQSSPARVVPIRS
jgi:HSP20 family protein